MRLVFPVQTIDFNSKIVLNMDWFLLHFFLNLLTERI